MSELPKGWAWATIPDLVAADGVFVDGDWVESKDQDPNGDVRLIQLADVGDGRYVDKSARFLTSARARALGCTFLQRGDVLVARMPEPLGRSCLFPGDIKQAVTVVDVCVVRTDPQAVHPRWLMHFINCHDFRLKINALQSGSTRKRISRGNLSTLALPVPPRAEQARIADKVDELLSELDAGIAELKTAQTKLQRYRQSLLKAAVQGDLTADWRAANPPTETGAELLRTVLAVRRAGWEADQRTKAKLPGRALPNSWQQKYSEPAGVGAVDLPPLPDGWAWATIQQLGAVQLGRQRSPDKLRGASPTKYIRAANITETGVDLNDVLEMDFSEQEIENFALRTGDVLLTEASGSPEHVGRPAIWEHAAGVYCFQNTVLRFRALGTSPAFSYWSFLAMQKLGVFRKLSSGVGINHLSAGKFAQLPVALPPVSEQVVIIDRLEAAFRSCRQQEEAINSTLAMVAAQRQNILRAAFAGQLVPQDPADEPAQALLARIRASRADAKPPARKRVAAARPVAQG